MDFNDQKVNLIETTQVKEGVVCDVYEFEDDNTKDLGIVKVSKGFKTPLQKVLGGEKTIEIFRTGVGQLKVIGTDKKERIYNFPGQQSEVEVGVGEIMQWEAIEDLTFAEVCYPPYKDGRFLNLDDYLQKFVDDFRFLIVDEDDIQRSSTWTIRQNKSEDSVFVYSRSHAQKMELSLHPREDSPLSQSIDRKDSQWGIKKKHREELEAQGFTVPRPLRWKRPYDSKKVKRVASILFPADYMTGKVYQYIEEKGQKVTIPMAKAGHAVEVSLFYSYGDQNPYEVAEQLLKRLSYTPIFYMTVSTGEKVNIVMREIPFDRSSLPKAGTYNGHRLTNQNIESADFIHAIYHNSPNDDEAICLIETNGFNINN